MNARLEKHSCFKCQVLTEATAALRLSHQMTISKLLVDLDGTLYDITNGYEEHVRQDTKSGYALRLHTMKRYHIQAVFCMGNFLLLFAVTMLEAGIKLFLCNHWRWIASCWLIPSVIQHQLHVPCAQ